MGYCFNSFDVRICDPHDHNTNNLVTLNLILLRFQRIRDMISVMILSVSSDTDQCSTLLSVAFIVSLLFFLQ